MKFVVAGLLILAFLLLGAAALVAGWWDANPHPNWSPDEGKPQDLLLVLGVICGVVGVGLFIVKALIATWGLM